MIQLQQSRVPPAASVPLGALWREHTKVTAVDLRTLSTKAQGGVNLPSHQVDTSEAITSLQDCLLKHPITVQHLMGLVMGDHSKEFDYLIYARPYNKLPPILHSALLRACEASLEVMHDLVHEVDTICRDTEQSLCCHPSMGWTHSWKSPRLCHHGKPHPSCYPPEGVTPTWGTHAMESDEISRLQHLP